MYFTRDPVRHGAGFDVRVATRGAWMHCRTVPRGAGFGVNGPLGLAACHDWSQSE